MKAKIYKPEKSVMQSGKAKTKAWVLEYELETARMPENVMGWTSSADTNNQVKINFASKSAAIMFAENNHLDYFIEEPHEKAIKPKNYMDNFKYMPLD